MLIDNSVFAVNPPEKLQVTVEHMDGFPVITVDNFYRDPELVRVVALSQTFKRRNPSYPGFEARVVVPNSPVMGALSELLRPHFGSDVEYGGKLLPVREVPVQERPQPSRLPEMARLRRSGRAKSVAGMDLDRWPQRRDTVLFTVLAAYNDGALPHFDARNGVRVGGVLYLNEDHQCSGGTRFFRHRKTGLVATPLRTSPAARRAMRAVRAKSLRELQMRLIYYGVEVLKLGSEDDWETTRIVEMKFNRVLLFDARLLHSINAPKGKFGTRRLEEMRLTQKLHLGRQL